MSFGSGAHFSDMDATTVRDIRLLIESETALLPEFVSRVARELTDQLAGLQVGSARLVFEVDTSDATLATSEGVARCRVESVEAGTRMTLSVPGREAIGWPVAAMFLKRLAAGHAASPVEPFEAMSLGSYSALRGNNRIRPASSANRRSARVTIDRETVAAVRGLARSLSVGLDVMFAAALQVLTFLYCDGLEQAGASSTLDGDADHARVGADESFRSIAQRIGSSAALGRLTHAGSIFFFAGIGSPEWREIVAVALGTSQMPARIGHLTIRRAEISPPSIVPAYAFSVFPDQSDLHCELNCADDGDFCPGRVLDHLLALLTKVAACPDQLIGAITVRTEADGGQERSWNETNSWFPTESCIQDMVFQSARDRPQSAAAIYYDLGGDNPGQTLTYASLVSRTAKLANYLRRRGVRPKAVVAVCLDPSLDRIVATLAILAVDAAYLPLDPGLPEDRLAYMLEHSGAKTVVSTSGLRPAAGGSIAWVCLDGLEAEIAGEAANLPHGNASPEDPAYVIYTSGSTGRPKGVVVSHRSLVNLIHTLAVTLSFDETDSMMLTSSPSFDISGVELFLPLTVGGRVVVGNIAGPADVARLIELLNRSRTTFMQATPSVWRLLIDSGWNDAPALTAIACGEALPNHLAGELISRCRRVWNLYGPTEATIYATGLAVRDATEPMTIGRPLPNTRIHILDRRSSPLPIGAWGELHIGGVNVAQGYHLDPILTAEKFVPDLFAPSGQNARLYKTGDLGRFRADGTIECGGRIDSQIKIHGIRIEPGEIENVLIEHDDVADAHVILHKGREGGGFQLVAYIVPQRGSPPSSAELRQHLQRRLVDAMIPTAFVAVSQFPLSPSGKIDRKRLPSRTDGRERTVFEAPAGSVEAAIAKIFSDVLGCWPVGRNDDFFALGGDSLKAMKVLARLRHVFGVELRFRDFFAQPTIVQLARGIKASDRPCGGSLGDGGAAMLASFAEQHFWLLSQRQPDAVHFAIEARIRLSGKLDLAILQRAIALLVARHDSLRTSFVMTGAQLRRTVDPAGHLVFAVEDVSSATVVDEAVELIAADKRSVGFNLERGPLLRATLLRLSAEENLLLLLIHHIVADGWSISVIADELLEIYAGLAANGHASLPPLATSCDDLARLQRRALTDERSRVLFDFWTAHLEGCPTVLDLATDYPRAAEQSYRGGTQKVTLPPELGDRLCALARVEEVTLFAVLFAAFHALLHRLTGAGDIIVGTPVADRRQIEAERVVGLFLNTLAIRSKGLDRLTFRELLRQFRETLPAAYDHQDLPIEHLIRALRPERDVSRPPLFQVYFNMLNLPQPDIRLGAPRAEILDLVDSVARFDLSLYAMERSGRINLQLVYAADLFSAATAAAVLQDMVTLLEAISDAPDRRITSLRLRAAVTRRADVAAMLRANNERAIDFPIDQSIPQRFADVVRRFPDRVAVRSENEILSYAELDAAAEDVARSLAATIRGAAGRVALIFGQNARMIAAIFGTLKAGHAYVPIDPTYPSDRIRQMLDDSEPCAILVGAEYIEMAQRLGREAKIPVIEPNGPIAAEAGLSAVPPAVHAYILYTSGSTGRPKGVAQSHRNVLANIRAYSRSIGICEEDRLSLVSSYAFDASVMDIFGALLNGATLVCIDVRGNGLLHLPRLLLADTITVYHSTPTLFRHLIARLPPASRLGGIRAVVLGGEQAHRNDLEAFKRVCPEYAVLVNGLGPTESTIGLQYFIDRQSSIEGELLPVGYPVEGTNIALLDRSGIDNELFGEIAIQGPGVALGYWQQPELTAAAFAVNPADSSVRTYRTGDVGRRLADGSILFLGRRDRQIKLRGHRIETAEIESILSGTPGVDTAAVLLHADGEGGHHLAAFVSMRSEGLSARELRNWLAGKLPSYMVPSRIFLVPSIATTATGKIDYQALATQAANAPEQEPQPGRLSETEVRLAAIWARVLGREHVSSTSNFFDLGGSSIHLAHVQALIESEFNIAIPMLKLLQCTTIASLAAHLLNRSGEAAAGTRPVRDAMVLRAQQRRRR